jgi:type I restriction enzyme S subunit
LDRERIDQQFLDYFFKVPNHWRSIGSLSAGTNVRRQSLHPTQFENAGIPLPPLAEQRRVVARIEELASEIRTARSLHNQAVEEAEALVISVHLTLAGDRKREIGEILELHEEAEPISPTGAYPQVGMRSFGGGLFPKAAVDGNSTTYRTFNRLYKGAVVLSQVKGWEGAVAVCPTELTGWFASPEYRTFRCVATEAHAEYLTPIVRTKWFWTKLASATRGVGARRERTRPEQFLSIELPMPDLLVQERGEAIFAELEALNRLHAGVAANLDALLPSIVDRALSGEL